MITLMMAMDIHGLIGKDNDLPWHFPEDLQFFKEKTLNKKVLMGRKTFESIIARLKKPLPNRENIILTRKDYSYENTEVIHHLESYLNDHIKEDLFVIGGKQVFDQTLKYADRIYVTYVKHLYKGDTFINIDYSLFNHKIIKETDDLIFVLYERILP
ncbi:dihydrofolate reductase [Mycoplasmatota bacterium]|nr:dihydrofolate reductase [Mycoplasmatota bacterium]